MSTGKGYWYVRHKGRISGPFSKGLIRRQVLLGRIFNDDEFSQDQMKWQRLSQLRDLVPAVMTANLDEPLAKQRLAAARRWADDRDDMPHSIISDDVGENVSGGKEVDGEYGQLSLGIRNKLAFIQRERWKNGFFMFLIFTLFIVVIGSYLSMNTPVVERSIDCSAAAEPAVVWDNCMMSGVVLRGLNLQGARLMNANLVGADLSSANMAGAELSYALMAGVNAVSVNWQSARLVGTNLQQANLAGANLSQADLSYANLLAANIRGVNFSGAKLDKVRWVDGRICAVGSVTHCQ